MSFYRYNAYPKGRKMKGIESLLLIGLIFTMLLSSVNRTIETGNEIRSETLRLHIIANSDSEEDQDLKLKVRDAILDSTGELFAEVSGKTEAVVAAEYSANDIKSIAENVIASEGFDYSVQVEVTEKALADLGVDAIMDVHRPLDKGVFAQFGKNLGNDLVSFFRLVLKQLVEAAAQVVAAQLLGLQFGVAGAIEFAGQQFFFFTHNKILPK